MNGYGTREVGQILGLSPSQVRSYVREGFLSPERGPRGQFRFSFPDLVFLRTARGLLDARIPPRRIRRALRNLARDLPDGRLSDLRIAADGGRIVAADGSSRWQPESGQTLFDFGAGELACPVAPLPHQILEETRGEEGLSAQGWYELACGLEPGAPEEAREAYERALRLDGGFAEAHVNLGRLLHERGEPAAAREHYLAALSARPDDATAAFNLGVALEDLGREREALDAYEQAIALDPVDADAHFNAANLCERLRDTEAAFAHWKRYRAITRDGK
jgi:tetratricopeptide (TPR) repeat protein